MIQKGTILKYKSDPNSRKEVADIINNNVVFTDNGRVSMDVVNEKFDIVNNQTIDNNIKQNSDIMLDLPPSNFGSHFYEKLQNINNPDYIDNSSNLDYEITNNPNISESTKKWAETLTTPTPHVEPRDEWMEMNFPNQQQQPINKPIKQQVKEVIKLPEMVKSKKVVIKLDLHEMIPKLEDVKAVQNLFKDVSIVKNIATEIADRYINDKDVFVGMIIEQLEKMMKPKKTIKRNVNKKDI